MSLSYRNQFIDLISAIVNIRLVSKHTSAVIRQKDGSQNGCFKKTKHTKFSEKRRFLTPYTHTYEIVFQENKARQKRTFLTHWYVHVRVRITGWEMFLFRKFGVLCFLETPILRFALLPYYRRYDTLLYLLFVILILNHRLTKGKKRKTSNK